MRADCIVAPGRVHGAGHVRDCIRGVGDGHRARYGRLVRSPGLPVSPGRLCGRVSCIGSAARLTHAREIGSYELVQRMGEGGMGEVWRARHRLLARPAALKLIRQDVLGANQRIRDAATRRFEREAQATAMLGSTHTIDIYDFGVSEGGDFYYVMELLDHIFTPDIQFDVFSRLWRIRSSCRRNRSASRHLEHASINDNFDDSTHKRPLASGRN